MQRYELIIKMMYSLAISNYICKIHQKYWKLLKKYKYDIRDDIVLNCVNVTRHTVYFSDGITFFHTRIQAIPS